MLKANQKNPPVEAVLKIDMVVEGEAAEAGDVVELSGREFKYLYTYNRVLPATKENIAIVKAEVEAQKKAASAASAKLDRTASLESQLAAAMAELAALKKAK